MYISRKLTPSQKIATVKGMVDQIKMFHIRSHVSDAIFFSCFNNHRMGREVAQNFGDILDLDQETQSTPELKEFLTLYDKSRYEIHPRVKHLGLTIVLYIDNALKNGKLNSDTPEINKKRKKIDMFIDTCLEDLEKYSSHLGYGSYFRLVRDASGTYYGEYGKYSPESRVLEISKEIPQSKLNHLLSLFQKSGYINCNVRLHCCLDHAAMKHEYCEMNPLHRYIKEEKIIEETEVAKQLTFINDPNLKIRLLCDAINGIVLRHLKETLFQDLEPNQIKKIDILKHLANKIIKEEIESKPNILALYEKEYCYEKNQRMQRVKVGEKSRPIFFKNKREEIASYC